MGISGRHHCAREDAEPAYRRRRHRGGVAARAPAQPRVRAGAGVLLRATDRRRGIRGICLGPASRRELGARTSRSRRSSHRAGRLGTMFILYAVVLGLVIGLLLGGQASRLGELKLRFAWVCLVGLAVQLLLFSDAVTERIGGLGVPIYVVSTFAVAAAVAANYRIPGMA